MQKKNKFVSRHFKLDLESKLKSHGQDLLLSFFLGLGHSSTTRLVLVIEYSPDYGLLRASALARIKPLKFLQKGEDFTTF